MQIPVTQGIIHTLRFGLGEFLQRGQERKDLIVDLFSIFQHTILVLDKFETKTRVDISKLSGYYAQGIAGRLDSGFHRCPSGRRSEKSSG